MNAQHFLDTNVLVYAYDSSDPQKHACAQELLRQGLRHGDAAVSVQVFGEFFTVVTRRIAEPMSADEARSIISTLSMLWVQDIDLALVQRAIDAHQQYGLAYWDSLIVAAAERAGCASLLSEDLNPGQIYLGVRVRNPFTRP